MLQRLRGLVWPQCSLSGSPVSTIQCPARVGFGQSRRKSEEKVLFTLFEKFKWKQNDLISRSRNESEIKMTGNWDREVKMKWKSFKIKKWNFSRILENFRKFKNYSWHTLFWVLHPPRLVNFFKNLVSKSFFFIPFDPEKPLPWKPVDGHISPSQVPQPTCFWKKWLPKVRRGPCLISPHYVRPKGPQRLKSQLPDNTLRKLVILAKVESCFMFWLSCIQEKHRMGLVLWLVMGSIMASIMGLFMRSVMWSVMGLIMRSVPTSQDVSRIAQKQRQRSFNKEQFLQVVGTFPSFCPFSQRFDPHICSYHLYDLAR